MLMPISEFNLDQLLKNVTKQTFFNPNAILRRNKCCMLYLIFYWSYDNLTIFSCIHGAEIVNLSSLPLFYALSNDHYFLEKISVRELYNRI
jgi:hypothetical protein